MAGLRVRSLKRHSAAGWLRRGWQAAQRRDANALRRRSLAPLPLLEPAALVIKAEVATGKPPLDGSAHGGPPAPAVGVAPALPVARVMDSLKESPRHARSLAGVRTAWNGFRPQSPVLRDVVGWPRRAVHSSPCGRRCLGRGHMTCGRMWSRGRTAEADSRDGEGGAHHADRCDPHPTRSHPRGVAVLEPGADPGCAGRGGHRTRDAHAVSVPGGTASLTRLRLRLASAVWSAVSVAPLAEKGPARADDRAAHHHNHDQHHGCESSCSGRA